jgi:hypothetical protein
MFLVAGPVSASGNDGSVKYDVTITNLTRGQTFTPILVASHKKGVKLFEVGSEASEQLALLAEDGATQPLSDLLLDSGRVFEVTNSGGLLLPGESVTIAIKTRGQFNRISMAAMLIPTNDGFFSIQGARAWPGNSARVLFSPAYDAGSEPNDELCENIPGPVCGGVGASPGAGGEGYVHIHAGVHGISGLAEPLTPDATGGLNPAERDWRNPVAKITIQRSK